MRLDKFLKVSRVIKRRTVAGNACKAGRVLVNGRDAKPGKQIAEGDEITIEFGSGALKVRVRELRESVPKDEAASMYEVIEG